MQRYKLIKTLLDRNLRCKLFYVGDDWQSIMGFAGSNMELFVNFDKYFKKPAITKISTNYRSIKTIVDAGADVIKNNGGFQIPKPTLSNQNTEKVIQIFCSLHQQGFKKQYLEQTAQDCLHRIQQYIQSGCPPSDILILSRYRLPHVIRPFLDKAHEMNINIAHGYQYPREDQVRMMTVHKSKGTQAKVVFVYNMIQDLYGFPCEVEDPEMYAPARDKYPPQHQIEEERRLFYVAMTRAKEDLIIYTQQQSKSQFLEEIKDYILEKPLYY